jgi:hypothetical protein
MLELLPKEAAQDAPVSQQLLILISYHWLTEGKRHFHDAATDAMDRTASESTSLVMFMYHSRSRPPIMDSLTVVLMFCFCSAWSTVRKFPRAGVGGVPLESTCSARKNSYWFGKCFTILYLDTRPNERSERGNSAKVNG